MYRPVERILLMKLRRMGDTLILTPTLRALRESYPDARVVVVVPSEWVELLETNPHLDRIIGYRSGSPVSFVSLIRQLRRQRFDLGINPHANLRSASILLLSGVPERVVDNRSGRSFFSTVPMARPPAGRPAVERDLDCVRALGLKPAESRIELFLERADRDAAEAFLEEQGLCGSVPLLAIAPGASAPAKRWPPERFAAVAGRLMREESVSVLLVGAPGESGLLGQIAAMMEVRPVFVQVERLRLLAAILERCSLFLGNDSGPKHLAVALGVPTLTLFGPEDAREWHPYADKEGHIAIMRDVDCRNGGCGKRVCDDHRCMTLIGIEEVLASARELLVLRRGSPNGKSTWTTEGDVDDARAPDDTS